MKYTQNFKISQITDNSLVIGVDIAKKKHYARAFDYRGIELDKVFTFKATSSGFERHGKKKEIVGIEPTGHYWYTFGQAVMDKGPFFPKYQGKKHLNA